jgi:hypothetical protein
MGHRTFDGAESERVIEVKIFWAARSPVHCRVTHEQTYPLEGARMRKTAACLAVISLIGFLHGHAPAASPGSATVAYDDSDGWYDHQMGPIANHSTSKADNWLAGERVGGGSFDAIAGTIHAMFDFAHPDARPYILDQSTGQILKR